MNRLIEILESRLADITGVYVSAGDDATRYLAALAGEVKQNECEPFEVSAVVMAPGLSGFQNGEEIAGFCVAKANGRWLVYRPDDDCFYAFWVTHIERLGAHGVFGSPLHCWSA